MDVSKFKYDGNKSRGKSNRLGIGQKVKAKSSLVDWYCRHLSWCYSIKAPENAGYQLGEKEIPLNSVKLIYAWTHAHLSNKPITGKVRGYGAFDVSEKTNKVTKRKCVLVDFRIKTEIGVAKFSIFAHEKDLLAIK